MDGQSRQLGYAADSQYYQIDNFADYVRDGLAKLSLEDVNRVIRENLSTEDIQYVFVTRGGSNPDSFNDDSKITSGLQELIVLYGGTVQPGRSSNVDFEPLIQTGIESGLLRWQDFVDEGGLNFFTMQSTANPRRNPFRRIDPETSVFSTAVCLTGSVESFS